ncbi:MAG: SGNH/GDSL hydrolase family protein [Planctomycetes bacterium]|nr:SGNH/GDSL hydrolase family protein [Planctomycetota bacterium]
MKEQVATHPAWTRRRWLTAGSGLLCSGKAVCHGGTDANDSIEGSVRRKDRHADSFRTLVALGESTTAGGWSTSRERCWVSVLGDLINDFQSSEMQVFNSGIGANVISTRSPCYAYSGKPAASERLDKHVIEHDPDLLVISYGLNDARGGTPLKLFRQELLRLVDRVRASIEPLIVLLGPYYMNDFTVGGEGWSHADLALFGQFNKVIGKVAEKKDCLYVDLLSAYQETDWMIHYDGVHANDLGHRIVANRIFEKIAQNCSGIAQQTQKAEKTSPRWRDESTLRSNY